MLQSKDSPRRLHDSNGSDIGVIPADWRVVSLDEVVAADAPIRYGVVQIGPNSEGGVPIVPIKHIREIERAPLHRASAETEAPYAGSRVRGGDVLLSVKGSIGEVGVVPSGFEGNIAREIARIRPGEGYDPDFIALQLEAESTQRRIFTKTVGSTRLEFSIHAVRDFQIAVPVDLAEQRRIAEILRTWDDGIAAAERLVVAYEKQLSALTSKLVFGSDTFAGDKPQRGRTQGEWFGVPQHWDIRPIAELASEVSIRNADAAISEVLSCSKHRGFVRSLDYFGKQVFSADLTTYKVIQRGEFGFPANHVEEGSIGLQNIADVGVVSPIYVVFRFDKSLVDERYALRVLKTRLFRHLYEVSTSASVDRRGSLRWSEFSKLPFPVAPLADQYAILRVLEDQERLVDVACRRRDALQRQKRGLMQKLLTGEWRTPSTTSEEATHA